MGQFPLKPPRLRPTTRRLCGPHGGQSTAPLPPCTVVDAAVDHARRGRECRTVGVPSGRTHARTTPASAEADRRGSTEPRANRNSMILMSRPPRRGTGSDSARSPEAKARGRDRRAGEGDADARRVQSKRWSIETAFPGGDGELCPGRSRACRTRPGSGSERSDPRRTNASGSFVLTHREPPGFQSDAGDIHADTHRNCAHGTRTRGRARPDLGSRAVGHLRSWPPTIRSTLSRTSCATSSSECCALVTARFGWTTSASPRSAELAGTSQHVRTRHRGRRWRVRVLGDRRGVVRGADEHVAEIDGQREVGERDGVVVDRGPERCAGRK